MWFDILMALNNHLTPNSELNGVAITIGANAKIPLCASVVLTRGVFNPKTTEPKSRDSQQLYVECWQWDESESPTKGYEKLAELEGIVMKALNDFGAGSNRVHNKQVRVILGQTEPDGDAFRPSVGSRTAVTVQWQ